MGRPNVGRVEGLTLVFSLVAATAGIVLWRLEWLKAPRHAWRVRRHLVRPGPGREGRCDVYVLPEGRYTVYSVVCTLHGDSVRGKRLRTRRNRVSPDSSPLHLTVSLADPDPEDLWVEITWVTLRPCLHHGERIDVHAGQFLRWAWLWRSLRVRGRPGEGVAGLRLCRTRGRWKYSSALPLVMIPGED